MLSSLPPESILTLVGCFAAIVISIYVLMRVTDMNDRHMANREDIDIVARKLADADLARMKDVPNQIEQVNSSLQRTSNFFAMFKDELAELRESREEEREKLYQWSEQFNSLFPDKELPVLDFEDEPPKKQRRPRSAPPAKKSSRSYSNKKPDVKTHLNRYEDSDSEDDPRQQLSKIRRSGMLERQ